jgi:hypothetical protein
VISRSAVLLLSLAFAAAPTAADYCAAECEAVHGHSAAGSTVHGGHHHHDHAAMALFSIDRAPQPCGHDHNGIIGVAASDGDAAHASAVYSPAPINAQMPAPPVASSGCIGTLTVRTSKSPPGTSLRGFACPIRI